MQMPQMQKVYVDVTSDYTLRTVVIRGGRLSKGIHVGIGGGYNKEREMNSEISG